jgi:hypothetical protein
VHATLGVGALYSIQLSLTYYAYEFTSGVEIFSLVNYHGDSLKQIDTYLTGPTISQLLFVGGNANFAETDDLH